MFICNTVKCRPPNIRDPHPNEIESCNEYLRRQVELIQPTVICTLGNFSTKLLRGDTTGISRLHGQAEVRTIGARAIRLYPLYHPAAALYTPSTLGFCGPISTGSRPSGPRRARAARARRGGGSATARRVPEPADVGSDGLGGETIPRQAPESGAAMRRRPRRSSWASSSS